jgi:GMP synthase-like glutamine amidotransferase
VTDQERDALQARLTEAKNVLHQLRLGQKEVSITSGGKTVSYDKANIGDLRAYISEMERELGNPSGIARPLRFRIG